MSVPGVYDLTLPVLRSLSDGRVHTTREMTSTLAVEFGLTDGELQRTRSDGRPLFQNRIEWARTHLKKAGLVEYPEPRASRITARGRQLLACDPRQLGPDFFKTESPPVARAAATAGTLEDELRILSGEGARGDAEWAVIRRLNGWGPEPPATYKQVSKETGLDIQALLKIGKACRTQTPAAAPLLDSALTFATEGRWVDGDELSLDLVRLGLTAEGFSSAGLCEAARRFGRHDAWVALLRHLAATHRECSSRPRPFDSWFEIDVFLYVTGLGHRVIPQRRIGNYRVDLLLPDFLPQLVIECDGDAFHGRERTTEDEARERYLLDRGYKILRFRYSDFIAKPHSIKNGLLDILSHPETVGVQLRAG